MSSVPKTALIKWVERVLFILILIGTGVLMYLFSDLYQRYQLHQNPASSVYGTWKETNVAPFAQDYFVLSEDGVMMDNRIVTTKFSLDNDMISFEVGGLLHQYKVLNQSKSEIRQLAPKHYQPIYELVGKHKQNLR
ncbi:hypothetical protein VHP8226_02109 [Vibrio hippocampi]|uniref:DUF2850 domain-containing protein n=2 Tax=Vibrio hippocampi TaxID=654686 RepID=A0ABM8ZJ46_9VIBR|nr:hypothetical protein VHP8226_02109 [Vibrio hippocampi]